MFRLVYGCIVEQHDLQLVILAGLICFFSCFTTASLMERTRQRGNARAGAWVFAAAVVFALGVWTTHFVAELAYSPGIPVSYDIGLTAGSLAFAFVVSYLGMTIALQYRMWGIGGAVVGAAVGGMHYIGMAAMRVPADFRWNSAYVLASLLVGTVFTASAMHVYSRGVGWRFRIGATLLLVLAICGLHFTAMTALVLQFNPLIEIPDAILNAPLLAVSVAGVTVLIIALGMSGSILDDRMARQAVCEAALLRDSETRLRHAMDNLDRAQRLSHTGSDVRDLATDHCEWSDESYRIFGVDPEDFVPTTDNFLSMVIPEDRLKVLASRAEIARGQLPAPFEYRIRRPDGDIRHIHRITELICDANGVPVQMAGTIRDVTELRDAEERQKQLERELLHSQKLEAVGTLAGGVAHGLNNALFPILALSRMILDDLPPTSDLREDIETILESAQGAKELVQGILAFSRKEAAAKTQIDLVQLVQRTLSMLRASLPTTLRIDEELASVAPIVADADALQQVLVNLVTNAAHAIGNAIGTITVVLEAARPEEVPGHQMANEFIRVRIADTGCGMDTMTAGRIFEPFFTTKNVGEGTGLGLSVVHGIVTDHGGQINVRSEPGNGTEFSIYLPSLLVSTPLAKAAA